MHASQREVLRNYFNLILNYTKSAMKAFLVVFTLVTVSELTVYSRATSVTPPPLSVSSIFKAPNITKTCFLILSNGTKVSCDSPESLAFSKSDNSGSPPVTPQPLPFTSPMTSPYSITANITKERLFSNDTSISYDGKSPSKRVIWKPPVKGRLVGPGEFPWHVNIFSKSSNILVCSGSIISPYAILTVAHCFALNDGHMPLSDFAVIIGKVIRDRNVTDYDPSQVYEVKNTHTPDSYFSSASLNKLGDVGIIQLKRPIKFSDNVKAISVVAPQTQITEYQTLYAVGYGVDEGKYVTSTNLSYVEFQYISNSVCSKQKLQETLTGDGFCGSPVTTSDFSFGDGGAGVLLREDEKSEPHLVGALSSLSRRNTIVVTDLRLFSTWIKNTEAKISLANN